MKITEIEVIPVAVPFIERIREHIAHADTADGKPGSGKKRLLIYKVHTDEGLVGVGEGWVDLPEGEIRRYHGRSPIDFILSDAAGQLLIAFYDLIGKAAGEPVYKYFGPRLRQRLPMCYWSHCYPAEVLAEDARIAAASGYTLHKIKARPYRDPVEQFAAIVESTPADYRIIVDPNESFGTVSNTLHICREYQRWDRLWALEEPIARSNLCGYRMLREKLPFPLAVHCEVLPDSEERALNQSAVCDVFVYEALSLGRAYQYVSGIAKGAGTAIWVENGLFSGISAAFQAHQAVSFPNLELCITELPILEDDLIVEPLPVVDGSMEVPEGPGLGVALDEDAVDRYRLG